MDNYRLPKSQRTFDKIGKSMKHELFHSLPGNWG